MRGVIEVAPIADIYADGLAGVELCGPNVRLIFYALTGGERVTAAKIVAPAGAFQGQLPELIAQARAGLEEMRVH
jgi:hypothetical protein